MAESRKFIWVEVNKDHTPELALDRFNVHGYPACIVLTADQRKVYRFGSYMKPEEFIRELKEGERRYALNKAGQEWDTPTPRPEKITEQAAISTFASPSANVPAGMAFLNGDLWIAFMRGELFKVDPATGQIRQKFTIPDSVIDICTDGKVLYAVESGWSAGKPIYQIDPGTGKITRSIVTAANSTGKGHTTRGMTWLNGSLYIFDSAKIHEVDPRTGDIRRTIKTTISSLSSSLAYDGQHLIVGSRTDLSLLDPATGAVVRKLPMNYPLRSVGFDHGAYYVMEQPVFGFDKDHKDIQVWPQRTVVYKLQLAPAVQGDSARIPN